MSIPAWVVLLVGTGAFSVAKSSKTFTSNFEAGDFSGWDKQLCCSHSAQVVTSPVREGEYAAKFTFRKSDPTKRAELKLEPVPANSEQWYGFSVFIPQEYTKDRVPEVITQWHNRPDGDLGENWRRPALLLRTKNDKFILENRWDSRLVTQSSRDVGTQKWDLGPMAKGQWTDWVVHARWSHKSDGTLEVWKNGKLVVQRTGPNTYNDKRGPFLKLGIYKAQWKSNPEASTTTERVIYFDEVRVGDASASYENVMPLASPTSSSSK